MPHGWVASDFIRSALDLFAYERESDHALVLAAGVPEQWLDGAGISIEHLRTPYGELNYSLHRESKRMTLHVAGRAQPPGGFVFSRPDGLAARVRINGLPAAWSGAEIRFDHLPATVLLEQ